MAITVYKPAGLPVFPPNVDPTGDCVCARLLADQAWRRDVGWPPGYDAGIAHRLDNSTSGAVVVADSLGDLEQIRRWFAAKQLTKSYRMLAAKDVPWDHNRCTRPIAHDLRKDSRVVVKRGSNTPHRGKWYEADTEFRRLRGRLFEVVIRTGVMHQIRAHAAFVGVPIRGDRRYGGGPTPDDAPPGVEFFLHHVGLVGPDGFRTDPVPLPDWARA